MKTIRLLPIVIFATIALLGFKAIGLITEGSYILTGTTTAVAAETGGGAAEDAAPDDAAAGQDIEIPAEPTLTDTDPTLADTAPTVKVAPDPEASPGGGQPAATPAAHAGGEVPTVAEQPAIPAVQGPDAVPPIASSLPGEACTEPACTDNGGAAPVVKDIKGNQVGDGSDTSETEKQILARLADRRDELDALSNELDMRKSLVEAAEKQLDQRTAELKAMEDRINALVDQQKAAEDAQFKSLVSMYENMRPQDAAKIFDALDMDVLMRVSQTINPRKMSPILAKMNTDVAKTLTARLAAKDEPMTAEAQVPADTGGLPQIVGH